MNIKSLSIAVIVAAMFLPACRSAETKQEDYNKAYQTAIAAVEKKRQADSDLSDDEYQAMLEASYPKFRDVGSEKVRMTGKFVKISEGQDSVSFKKYNAVITEFRQLFNARSLASRMRDAGYTDVFIVETTDPLYYVVTATADTPEALLPAIHRLTDDKNVVKKAPYPLILIAGNAK